MDKATMKRIALVATNTAMMVMWARSLFVIANGWKTLADADSAICEETLRPTLLAALAVSFLELFTSLIGLTRSNPTQVLLFSTVRAGVEVLVAPLLPCACWQHLFTATCWSLGDVVRFGCFALDSLSPQFGSFVKATRYTVGPLLFPLGASGEMLMVMRAANDGRPAMYIAAALWPAGFYPLMTQLLRQRRKYFSSRVKTE